jgi:hypothetical protein
VPQPISAEALAAASAAVLGPAEASVEACGADEAAPARAGAGAEDTVAGCSQQGDAGMARGRDASPRQAARKHAGQSPDRAWPLPSTALHPSPRRKATKSTLPASDICVGIHKASKQQRASQHPAIVPSAAKRERAGALTAPPLPSAAALFNFSDPSASEGESAADRLSAGGALARKEPASRRKNQQVASSDTANILMSQGRSADNIAAEAESAESEQQPDFDMDAVSPWQDWKLSFGGKLCQPAGRHGGAPACSRMLAYAADVEPISRAPTQRAASPPANHLAEAPLQEPYKQAAGPARDDAQQCTNGAQQADNSELWVRLWQCCCSYHLGADLMLHAHVRLKHACFEETGPARALPAGHCQGAGQQDKRSRA